MKYLEKMSMDGSTVHFPARAPVCIFFCIFALYISYAPGPHNKANLCCTTLQVAGLELHMSTYQPTKTFLLHAEEGRVDL